MVKIITIGREFGSSGRELGKRLAGCWAHSAVTRQERDNSSLCQYFRRDHQIPHTVYRGLRKELVREPRKVRTVIIHAKEYI